MATNRLEEILLISLVMVAIYATATGKSFLRNPIQIKCVRFYKSNYFNIKDKYITK